MIKKLPAKAGDAGDVGSIPGSGRSPGEGNGNPLQYSCLGNPTDREGCSPWVAKSQTRLSTHAHTWMASQAALVVKNLPASEGDGRDMSLIPGWGRSPGSRHNNPLQYSCLENPMDSRAWSATVYGVSKSRRHWSDLAHRHREVALPF